MGATDDEPPRGGAAIDGGPADGGSLGAEAVDGAIGEIEREDDAVAPGADAPVAVPAPPDDIAADPLRFLQQITRVAPTVLYVFDLREGRNIWVNRSVFGMLGYEEEELARMGGLVLPTLMHPEDLERYEHHYERLLGLADGERARFEYRMRHRDGSWRWLVSEEMVFERDGNGAVQRIVGSAHDNTEVKEREEHDRLIQRELNHRVKNLFAIVPAIVKLSARGSTDVGAMRENIVNRIAALSRAHALTIASSSERAGVLLEDMTRAVIEPYGDDLDRIVISGPPVRLSSRAGSAIGLALHELATNAAKYGALSVPKGTVRIAWVAEELPDEPADRGRRLRIQWSEAGGPEVVGTPEARGFGTRVIDQLIGSQDGTVERQWKRYGLAVTIEMPLHAIGQEPHFPAVGD